MIIWLKSYKDISILVGVVGDLKEGKPHFRALLPPPLPHLRLKLQTPLQIRHSLSLFSTPFFLRWISTIPFSSGHHLMSELEIQALYT